MHRLETMSYKIIIKELRSIKYLEFDVPTSGVHILTGCNGCGKTSLLITLNRICNNTAFSSLKLGRKVGMDKFSSTRITYTNGTSIITYKRTNRGWEPTPSKAKPSDIFPFADCRFITTSGFRFFEPNPDNFYKTGGGHVAYADAPVEIKEGLNILHLYKSQIHFASLQLILFPFICFVYLGQDRVTGTRCCFKILKTEIQYLPVDSIPTSRSCI